MRVQLISLTQPLLGGLVSKVINDKPVDQDRNFTAEELIVYIARVSNPSNQSNLETAPKLIRYLINNKHWSPFEMANMCVEVQTSRAVAAQILRHWNIAFQEFSQRYAEVTEFEDVELRYKAEKNRQSSSEVIGVVKFEEDSEAAGQAVLIDQNPELKEVHVDILNQVFLHLREGKLLYKKLIKAGIAKECARMILPLTTRTTIYMNGDIRTWIHYLAQRTDEHAQKEHHEVAKLIQNIFVKNFPNIAEALGIYVPGHSPV